MEKYDKKIMITTKNREEMKKLIRSGSIDMNCGGFDSPGFSF